MAQEKSAMAGNRLVNDWRRWLRELLVVGWGGCARLYPRLWIIVCVCVAGALLVLFAGPTDNLLLKKLQVDNPDVEALAKTASKHSDLNFAVPFSLLLWGVGAALGKSRLRKVGLACLLGTLMAGLLVSFFRFGMGRPRPYAAQPHTELADGFYGPHTDNDFRSYPSGHATTSSASAASVAGAIPVLAVPGIAYAVVVSWSRIQLDKHHPIDVTVGTICGTLCGLCFASTVPCSPVRLRRKRRRTKKSMR